MWLGPLPEEAKIGGLLVSLARRNAAGVDCRFGQEGGCKLRNYYDNDEQARA